MPPKSKSVAQRVADTYDRTVFTRADLRVVGMSGREITDAVRRGHLIRVRRDRYLRTSANPEVIEAVRIGGRLSCLSLLKTLGVFVHRCSKTHVFVEPGTSRIRPGDPQHVVVHWNAVADAEAPLHAASLMDAVRQSMRCQAPRAALATLDSLAHHGVLTREQIDEVLLALPSRFRALARLVDASAASGPETYVRLLLRSLGVDFETQVQLPGVGRVDFLVDGWLIIECDSREFHEGWGKQVEDRRRDIAAARLGYVTIRPLATEILRDDSTVRDMLQGVISTLGPRFTA